MGYIDGRILEKLTTPEKIFRVFNFFWLLVPRYCLDVLYAWRN